MPPTINGIFRDGKWSCGFDFTTTPLHIFDIVSGFPSMTGAVTRFGTGQSFIGSLTGVSGGYGSKTLNVNLPTIITGFAFRLGNLPSTPALIASFFDTTANAGQFSIGVTAQGRLQFYSGTWIGSATFTALGPDSGQIKLNPGVWYYLEIKGTINSTTGLVECRMNGNPSPIITFTGNTQSTANAYTNQLVLGGSGLQFTDWFDDWYVLDFSTGNQSYLGDIRILTLVPSADSATAGLNQFGTTPSQSAGNHFLNVDEIPPDDDTSYNADATVNDRESYRTAGVTVTGGIQFVNVWPRTRKDDAGSRSVAATARSNSVDAIGNTVSEPSSYGYFNEVFQNDPNTGVAWLQAGVNAAEFGLKVIS